MKGTTTKAAVGIAIACVLALGAARCSSALNACGNEQEVRFHEVVLDEECSDCMEVEFSSPIVLETTHKVRPSPGFVLERCTIAVIQRHPDALMLALTPDAGVNLINFRDSLTSRSKDTRVLMWIQGREAPIGLLYAYSLFWAFTLFDFEFSTEVDRLVSDLRPDPRTVVASDERRQPKEVVESEALKASKALLRQLDNDIPILEEARAAIDAGADDATVRKILDRLESVPPSE